MTFSRRRFRTQHRATWQASDIGYARRRAFFVLLFAGGIFRSRNRYREHLCGIFIAAHRNLVYRGRAAILPRARTGIVRRRDGAGDVINVCLNVRPSCCNLAFSASCGIRPSAADTALTASLGVSRGCDAASGHCR